MFKIPPKIEYVINTLGQNGFEAYIVGGCVRDMLLGKEPQDFDVTTSAKPNEIQSLFKKTVPTGIKHGTVTVIIDNIPIEVTTFRKEGEYSDHRRPQDVIFVNSLKEDLSRRDFTVNALAYNNKDGLKDYFDGKTDLNSKILRAVGNPEKRFSEDALRILRLFRFSSVLEFECEENTLNAAIKYAPTLKNISSERIFAELYKCVGGENVSALAPLINNKGLEFLNVTENPDYAIIKKFNNPNLRFFAFLYLSNTDVLKALEYLKVSNKMKNYCKGILNILDKPLPDSKTLIKRSLCDFSPQLIKDMLLFKKTVYNTKTEDTEKLLTEILKNNEPYLISHLKITGEEIKELRFTGNEIGKVLKVLQDIVIQTPEMNQQEKLIKEVMKLTVTK